MGDVIRVHLGDLWKRCESILYPASSIQHPASSIRYLHVEEAADLVGLQKDLTIL